MSENTHTPVGESLPKRSSISRQSPVLGFWGILQSVVSTAIIVATLFTLWSPNNVFSGQMFDNMMRALQSKPETTLPQPTSAAAKEFRIGLVAGHNGYDPGAVCGDGLTEASVNMKIATLTRQYLLKALPEYEINLLQEFDPLLNNYQAIALISIHNDTCEYVGNDGTGFKVAAASGIPYQEKANRLQACLIDRYRNRTGLTFRATQITADMRDYHAFNEIDSNTPAIIIETGFLNMDRELLVNNTELVAQGVAEGILCYVLNEPIPLDGS